MTTPENVVTREEIPARPEMFTVKFWVISLFLLMLGPFGVGISIAWAIVTKKSIDKWDRQYGHLNLERVEIAEAS